MTLSNPNYSRRRLRPIRLATRSGSAIVLAVITTAILLMLLGIIFSFNDLLQVQSGRTIRNFQALNLAEAGVSHGIAEYRNNQSYTGQTDPNADSTKAWAIPRSTGDVEIYIDKTCSGGSCIEITSRSYVPSRTALIKSCQTVQVEISNASPFAIVPNTYQVVNEGCPPPGS